MSERSLALAAPMRLDNKEQTPPQPVEIICGELRTGRILTTVPAKDAPWSMAYNDAGTVDATVPLGAMQLRDAQELVSYLEPTRCYLAARVGDHILEAGPIWHHDWNEDDKSLTARAGGLWTLWDHRKVMKILAAGQAAAESVLEWRGLSLGTIAKRLVQTAMSHTGGSLPLVLPGDVTAVDDDNHRRAYPGYDLKNMGEALRQLTEVLGGPDIRFTPRLTADRLGVEWVMTHGTETQPLLTQSGADWAWDLTVPRSGLSGVSVKRDASKMAQRAWVPGDGMAESMPIAVSEDLTPTSAGYPLLEVDDQTHTSVTNETTLARHAEALRDLSRRPWATWSWQARADDQPPLGEYRPGDWAAVNIPDDHIYLSAIGVTGRRRARIIGISGGLNQVVTINCAPMLEAR